MATQTILSDSRILKVQPQTIDSTAKVIVNGVVLTLSKSTVPAVNVGTASNPIIFTSAIAGETTLHPDNPFLLYNDRGGGAASVDAKSLVVEVLEMSVLDEPVGVSSGAASQVFTVAFIPVIDDDVDNDVVVKVGVTVYNEVDSFAGQSGTAEVYVVDYTLGTITFGNDINGKIPPASSAITVTYSPNQTRFGTEARTDGWFGVQSTDVVKNDRELSLDPSTATSTSTAQAAHIPLIPTNAVTGVFLTSDPNRLGTNYFTGGSYNAVTGLITLGTILPDGTTSVLMDYSYEIKDDAESDFTQLATNIEHAFANSIPSNNAKKLNFQMDIPSGVSPTNGVRVKVRLKMTFTEA